VSCHGRLQDPSAHLAPAVGRRPKKTQAKKTQKQRKKICCCHRCEEDPLEEDPIFNPADSLHFQNGVDNIEKVSSGEGPTVVYAPVQKPKKDDRDPYEPRPDDSEAIGQWRKRMGTAEAKEIYKDRASTAECVNAIARNRGLQQFPVRGLQKVQAVVLWFALAHNLMRAVALRAEAAAIAG